MAAVAQAVHDENLFELGPAQGADILGDGIAGNGPDWGDLFDANGNSTGNLFGGLAATFLNDDTSQKGAIDRTTYSGAGGSNKNNDPISTADCPGHVPPLIGSACDTWHWDAGNVPPKDDLVNSYVYARMPTTGPRANHLILYGGLERLDESGDSHVDLEFMQNAVNIVDGAVSGLDALPCNDAGPDVIPCEFNGVRQVNDVIVSMDFAQGGAIGEVEVRRWNGHEYVQEGEEAGEGCDPDHTICAFNNGQAINGGPWPNLDRGGNTVENLLTNAFTEIGVDVTALLDNQTPCISTVMGKSRSSTSFTAELKDFSPPESFEVCDGKITIEPDAVNEVGDDHTFEVNVARTIGTGETPVPDGTIVDVDLTNANGADYEVSEDTCAGPGTVGGICSITFTSDTTGTVTGHAKASFNVGGTTITVETDGEGQNSGDAVKRFVDARISIEPDAVNEVGDEHTFVVDVEQDDGLSAAQGGDGVTGFAPAPANTLVDVALTNANGAVNDVSANTCDDPLVGGTCFITFTSNSAGVVTGHATAIFTLDGVQLTRETDGQGQNSGDAVKRFVDARIAIEPDAVNEVGDDHTFTVTVEQNDGLPAGQGGGDNADGFGPAPDNTIVNVTLTDSNGADNEISENSCAAPGTDGGECRITFTSDSAGVVTGHATVMFTIDGEELIRATDGEGQNSGDAVKRFVDARIAIEPDAVNEVGDDHTFTVTVEQDDGLPAGQGGGDSADGFGPAPDNTIVTVALADSNGAVNDISENTCDDPLVGGTCFITFTSGSAGRVTGHATATFTLDGVVLTRETDGEGENSGDAVKRFVDATISIAPGAVNEVGDDHTFTVTVEQNDGLPAGHQDGDNANGFGPAPDGTIVEVTLVNANGAVNDISENTCASPGTAGGECSITFTSDSAGVVTGHATVMLTVGGVDLTRQTNDADGNSGDAVKRFVDARISIAPDAVNEVGDEHTFTVTVEQDDGLTAAEGGDGVTGFGPAPANTLVDVTLTDSNGADNEVSQNTCGDPLVGGTCFITFTSNSAGVVTGHATATFTLDGVVLTRETDAQGENSGDAIKRFVDAKIAITPDDTNSVGEDHTFVVNLQQDDGLPSGQAGGDDADGFGPAPDSTSVDVTLTDTGGAVSIISVNTCSGIGTVNGECSVTFTSNTAGTVTGHAAVTFVVGTVSLTRETDDAHGNSGDAEKVFVSGSIAWRKVDNARSLQGGATFELCRTHDLDTSTDPDTFVEIDPRVCLTVPDGGALDADGDPGEFLVTGLRLGRYTIDETVAPPGFEPDPKIETVDITLSAPNAVILSAFVNERPILKITGFGYENEASGTPTAGVVSGTATYTVDLHNYGGAATSLIDSSLEVSVDPAGAGTLVCGPADDPAPFTLPIIGSVDDGGDLGPITLECEYDGMQDGAVITAELEINYSTNGLTRAASGSPATISFTVQSD